MLRWHRFGKGTDSAVPIPQHLHAALAAEENRHLQAAALMLAGDTQPASQFDSWEFPKDKLRLVSFGFLVGLAMAAIEIGINAIFGRW